MRHKFLNYYRGSFYGRSSSGIFYQLGSQLNKSNKDMLWYWIVGLTDLQLHQKSEDQKYSEEIQECNDEVFKLHPIKHNQEAVEQFEQLRQDDQDYKDKDLFKLVTLETQTQELGTISIE